MTLHQKLRYSMTIQSTLVIVVFSFHLSRQKNNGTYTVRVNLLHEVQQWYFVHIYNIRTGVCVSLFVIYSLERLQRE